MSQTKKHSVFETVTNTAVGYGISFAANFVVLPQFGMRVSVRDSLAIGLIFTVISLVRGYVLRRIFNYISARRQEQVS